MNITRIRLMGLVTVDLPISVAQPSDPFILKAGDGLGPPDMNVSIQGRKYQGRQPENRQLVFRVGLTPNFTLNQTAADLRTTLYGMLTPEGRDDVPVQFIQGATVVAETSGYVSKIEIVPFAKDPEVQVTIDCTTAYLSSPIETNVVPTTKDAFTLVNLGGAPTGFEAQITLTQAQSVVTLFGVPGEKMRFEYAFLTGDVLRFGTVPEERYVEIIRGGTSVSDAIDALSGDSTWLMLRGGNNEFTTSMQTFNWGYVKYTAQYWGV